MCCAEYREKLCCAVLSIRSDFSKEAKLRILSRNDGIRSVLDFEVFFLYFHIHNEILLMDSMSEDHFPSKCILYVSPEGNFMEFFFF